MNIMRTVQYVEMQLKAGLNLSRTIVSRGQWDRGLKFIAVHGKDVHVIDRNFEMSFSSSQVNSHSLIHVENGVKVERVYESEESRRTLIAFLKRNVGSISNLPMLISEYVLVPRMELLQSYKINTMTVDGETYAVQSLIDPESEIERVLRRVDSFVAYNGFVFSDDKSGDVSKDPNYVIDLVSRDYIFGVTQAFDFEGYVVFVRGEFDVAGL